MPTFIICKNSLSLQISYETSASRRCCLMNLGGRRTSSDITGEKWVSGLEAGRAAWRAEPKGLKAESSPFIKGVCVSRNYGRSWRARVHVLAGALSVGVQSAAHHRWWRSYD